jgi:hypothetical protein
MRLQGHPMGPGTTCASVDCETPPPPMTMACCLPDGTCQDLTGMECMRLHGHPQGPGTSCANVQCR